MMQGTNMAHESESDITHTKIPSNRPGHVDRVPSSTDVMATQKEKP